MDRPESSAQKAAESEDSTRSVLSANAFADAKSLGDALNERPSTQQHLTNVMSEISKELEARSGNKQEYNAFLNVVGSETSHRPEDNYHLEMKDWNESAKTWGNVELIIQNNPVFKIVQPGDTLGQIATDYKSPYSENQTNKMYMDRLVTVNGIENPSLIRVGESINLLHGD